MLKPLMIAALGALALAGGRAQADDWSRIRLSFATDWGWIDTEWGDGPDYGYRDRYRNYDRHRDYDGYYGRYDRGYDHRYDRRYGARGQSGPWRFAPGYYRGSGYYFQGGSDRRWHDDRWYRERYRDDRWRGSDRWRGDDRRRGLDRWHNDDRARDRERWRRDDH